MCLDVGQVWANILHNVYAALVKQYGFSKSAKTNPEGKEGNVVFLHLMIDALALQPCYPKCERTCSCFHYRWLTSVPFIFVQLLLRVMPGFRLIRRDIKALTSAYFGKHLQAADWEQTPRKYLVSIWMARVSPLSVVVSGFPFFVLIFQSRK